MPNPCRRLTEPFLRWFREPLYAHAERSCLWELVVLAACVHPSVAAMARSLLAGAPVVYSGDPLRDLSLTAFLDKFVQRKPKARPHSTSVLCPGAVGPSSACSVQRAAVAARLLIAWLHGLHHHQAVSMMVIWVAQQSDYYQPAVHRNPGAEEGEVAGWD